MNPLFWLELRIRIRERKFWVLSFLFLLCFLVLELLPLSTFTRGTQPLVEPNELGRTFLVIASFTLEILLLILAPLSSASLISQEREQRTLPGLLNSPLSAWQIAWGKLLMSWAFILWLVSLSLPFFVVSVLWSGVPTLTLLIALAIVISSSFFTATVGLGLSGYFRRSLTSNLSVGLILFGWLLIWPLIGAIFYASFAGHEKTHLWITAIFYTPNPIYLLSLNYSSFINGTQPYSNALLCKIMAIGLSLWLIFGVFSFVVACRGLRQSLKD